MKKTKKVMVGLLSTAICVSLMSSAIVLAQEDNDNEYINNEVFISLDEEGNIVQTPLEEVETPNQEEIAKIASEEFQVVKETDGQKEIVDTKETKEEAEEIAASINRPKTRSRALFSTSNANTATVVKTVKDVEYGVVLFKNTGTTLNYTNANTGVSGYLTASYSPEAAYLGMSDGKVKFKVAGVTGLIDSSLVDVVDYDTFINSGKLTSVYQTTNGKLYHALTTNLTTRVSSNLVGYQQSYMQNNATYYSYDGHYFYTNYKTMLKDYKNNSHSNAINPSNAYYNYYQFLSFRSKTGFTASQFDQYINANAKANSKLRGLGSAFVSHQNTYGANAILMLGVAINESAWGSSGIALNKNNLFGYSANDSNPSGDASVYDTPEDSVKFYAKEAISNQYLDILDWRYFGPHLGDKESGLNVKYASDPYWGEKAAARGYHMQDYFSSNKSDYSKYTIGLSSGNVSIYKDANKSKELYSTGNGSKPYNTNDVGVIVLEKVTGESINGNNVWYKIQTDTPLNSSRTSYSRDALYDFSRDYGYMHSSQVRISTQGSSNNTSTYKRGDVNGNSEIDAADYLMIKDNIMGKLTLNALQKQAADVNGNGEIDAADYLMIKDCIIGKISL